MHRLIALTALLVWIGLALVARPAAGQQGQNQFQVMDLGSAFSGQTAPQPGKQSQQVKQQKQKECARQANDQKLRGDARQRFMQSCMGGS